LQLSVYNFINKVSKGLLLATLMEFWMISRQLCDTMALAGAWCALANHFRIQLVLLIHPWYESCLHVHGNHIAGRL